jgi:chromosome segregation ATPase
MKRITADTTSLNEFGLTPELILQGERAEFDPEPKPNPKKASYVRHDFAVKLMEAYADDLLQAYRAIDELEMQVTNLQDELEKTEETATKAAGQVKDMLKGNEEFANAEKLLAKFEQQLEQLAQDKQMDKSTIDKLQNEVKELVELRDTVPALKEDVNTVLMNLRSYFDEEGIEIPKVDD